MRLEWNYRQIKIFLIDISLARNLKFENSETFKTYWNKINR